jgi:hypothetical protein
MNTFTQTKINRLLSLVPTGTVILSSWLVKQGYSSDLQKRYRKSNWLKSIGTGAMIRFGDKVNIYGALYALQKHAGLSIHIGAKSALSLLGKAHYLELSSTKTLLFGAEKEVAPKWFKNNKWDVNVEYYNTSFLPSWLGLEDFNEKNFSIKISCPALAIMECLYLTPNELGLQECLELMEGLNNLKPILVQELLEQCTSIKVKRLFLFLAERAGHEWLHYLDLNKIDLGSGKRSLIKNGVYVSKYKITVPKEIMKDAE